MKKGFTLMELLAVIVIISVISLIIVPILLNMITAAQRGAAIDSAYGYIDATEKYLIHNNLKGNDNKAVIGENKVTDLNKYVKYKGNGPVSGIVIINEKNTVSEAIDLCISGYSIQYNDNKAYINGKCNDGKPKPSDKKPCKLEEAKIDDKEYLYIDSVEDFYAFSSSVNKGNTYSGKIVKIRTNLDFRDYDNKKNVCETDDNKDGFEPIGSNKNPFKGTLDGGAKTISNLKINRSNNDNVGIFGYTAGANIYGLTLENISVTGLNYVGSIVGYADSSTNVREIILKDINIKGSDYVSGFIGRSDRTQTNIIIKSGTVEANSWSYAMSYNYGASNSIIEGIDLKGSSVNYGLSTKGYYSNKCTVNGKQDTSGFDKNTIGDINFYETAGLDTWIGGDNDSTGYYFDYSGNDIVLKSTESDPISFNLKGSGEIDDPYLINNAEDFKEAAGIHWTGKVYKLMNDIDFSGQKFYMLGSEFNTFKGTFDGSAKTLKNIDIKVPIKGDLNNIGVFGKANSANIYGLTLENVNVSGNTYVGSLVGYADSSTNVKEIVLKKVNIKGSDYISGFIGRSDKTQNNIIIKSGTVEANSWSYAMSYNYGASNSIIESIDLKGSSVNYGLSTKGYYSNKCILNEKKDTYGFDGNTIGDINFYEEAGLDTWIGGDNDSTGYYFDYSGDDIVLKSTKDNPITFNLKGSGTESDPYLINDVKDFKEAAGIQLVGKVFKLTKNIDFSNQKFYMLGSEFNTFKGTFDGSAKTLKNINIKVPIKGDLNNIGVFGKTSSANIYGLTLENVNVSGNTYVGSLVGYADSSTKVKEIVLKNIHTKGSDYISGFIGRSDKTQNNILIKSGTVEANSWAYAMSYNYSVTNSIIESIDLKGSSMNYGLSTKGYYSNKCTLNGNKDTNGFDGNSIGEISFYEEAGLDTWIGGDNDSTGYYFDYNGNDIVLKNIKESPITFNLSGKGTKEDPYLIKNTSDWRIASGKKYSLDNYKYFKITNDIDFSNQKIYMLGSEYNKFIGTIYGNDYVLKNANINVPTKDGLNSIGLFGNIKNSTIIGLNLNNVKINGNSNVGGMIGYAESSNIYGLNVEDVNISGNTYVGSLIGYADSSTKVKEVVLKNIHTKGSDYISGFIGRSDRTQTNIIIKSGTVEANSWAYAMSYNYGVANSIVESIDLKGSSVNYGLSTKGYYSNKCTLNGKQDTNGFDEKYIGDINFYEIAGLDTWIGGDNDSTGYYFDYNGNDIVLKLIKNNPITFNLKGSGTKSDPYLIYSVKDFKEAAGIHKDGKVYKLMNDIDFSGQKFYMLGSEFNTFKGTFDGSAKTLKNIDIKVPIKGDLSNVGVFGKANSANIYGLNLENVNVSGYTYVGSLVGYADSSTNVKEIVLKNVNTKGSDYISGFIGRSDKTQNNIIIKSGTVEANSWSYAMSYNYGASNSIIESIDLKGSSVNYGLSTKGYYSNKCILNEKKDTYGFDGNTIGDINFYEEAGLDTWIGGDNDSTGYYFDYSGDDIVLKSTKDNPITFNLKGSGTESDPYLINSVKDFKEAAGIQFTGKVYKLMNDIDFSGQKFYMLGSEFNTFKGTFDGNTKTLKNINIKVPIKGDLNNIGVFGKTSGANIYGLNLENVNVSGYTYVGSLVGYADSSTKVKEIVLKNIYTKGSDYISGFIGRSDRTQNNILIKSGTVEANSWAYAMSYNYSVTNSIIESINLKGSSVNYGLSTKGYYSNKCTINGNKDTNGFASDNIDDIDYYTWKVETRIEGDTNKTGYYFDYIYSKDEVGLVKVGDTSNKPPFEPTEDNTSSGKCTVVYGKWLASCSPYTSGIHGGYAYKLATDAAGASCTGMDSKVNYFPAYRAKVTYKCS